MNLEKFLNLLLSNPENISIQYSNINGDEKLIVNGEEVNSEIEERINKYKENLKKLDDCVFEEVLEEAEARNFNLVEMNRVLELDSFTKDDEIFAANVIDIMSELIKEILADKIKDLSELMEEF